MHLTSASGTPGAAVNLEASGIGAYCPRRPMGRICVRSRILHASLPCARAFSLSCSLDILFGWARIRLAMATKASPRMSAGRGQRASVKSVCIVGPPIPLSDCAADMAKISKRALVHRLLTLEIRVRMERSVNLSCSSSSKRFRLLLAEEFSPPPWSPPCETEAPWPSAALSAT